MTHYCLINNAGCGMFGISAIYIEIKRVLKNNGRRCINMADKPDLERMQAEELIKRSFEGIAGKYVNIRV